MGVMEDSEPASMAVGMSYAMFAEDALLNMSLSNKAIEVLVGSRSCSRLLESKAWRQQSLLLSPHDEEVATKVV